jgi:hypothetical protein
VFIRFVRWKTKKRIGGIVDLALLFVFGVGLPAIRVIDVSVAALGFTQLEVGLVKLLTEAVDLKVFGLV